MCSSCAATGSPGFPEAIAATWPSATVQTCVVHLIRASMRFIGYQDRKKVAAALRPVYTAADAPTPRRTHWMTSRPPSSAGNTRQR